MENQVARRFLGLLQAEWLLWIMWVLATTAVGFLGVVGLMFGAIAESAVVYALAVVFGVLLGTAQWMLLHKRVPRAGQWVWATAVGWIVCAFVNLGAGRIVPQFGNPSRVPAGYYLSMAVISVLWGTMIGTAQWMFLRERVHRASRWVWATAMGWGVGWCLGWGAMVSPLARVLRKPGGYTLFFATFGVTVGIAVGAITGYVLNVLLRYPISAVPDPQQEANTR